MRVLMVTDFYPPFVGGVEVAVSGAARELVARGHEVSVATLGAPDLPPFELDAGVRVHRVRSTTQRMQVLYTARGRLWAPPTPDPAAARGLRHIVACERPDVIHGHDWLARSVLPISRRVAPPLVMSLHYFTLSCPKKSLLYRGSPCSGPALGKCLACAGRHYGRLKGAAVVGGQFTFASLERGRVDLYLPVSEATAQGNGLPQRGLPYTVVPNLVSAPPDDADETLLGELPSEAFLLFVGDARGAKGINVLLEAYQRLDAPPPLVLLAKVWPESPTQLPPGVTLHENWPNSAVRAAMSRCLALVAPSVLAEPFGIVIVEALAAGRPVVASAIGGIPELVRHEREALLVPPADVNALEQALARIIEDHELRERLAAAAATRARSYAPDAVIPQLQAAYERAVQAS